MRLLLRRIWFRAALFSVSSVALALLAAFVAPFIPYEISTRIGSDAVDNILGILASSMLAVTTFSLTAMVSAFSAASGALTPRATQLLVEDSTAQNALSTFIGAFLFSIVGICALSTGIYGKSGRVILFIGTILVIAIIVLTLLRWIGHLSNFGRVGNTIDRVEAVAKDAIDRSGYRIRAAPETPVAGAGRRAVFPQAIGYVTHIDLDALDQIARRLDCTIDVEVMPGAFVTAAREIVWMDRGDSGSDAAVRGAFTLDHHRQFDHDPRLGLIVLSEIAARALSPAVNDPGTAIAVLGSGVRVMTAFLERECDAPAADRVRLRALDIGDLLDDLFRPIARDGAAIVEVSLRLQRSLAELAAITPVAHGLLAVRAADALRRCETAMSSKADIQCVREAYRSHWAPGATGNL